LNLLGSEEIADVDEVFLEPPEGDDSDGYYLSDTEEGESVKISRTILQVNKEKSLSWLVINFFLNSKYEDE
jgi:hypothetical protein